MLIEWLRYLPLKRRFGKKYFGGHAGNVTVSRGLSISSLRRTVRMSRLRAADVALGGKIGLGGLGDDLALHAFSAGHAHVERVAQFDRLRPASPGSAA
jgi:hypothetical protein